MFLLKFINEIWFGKTSTKFCDITMIYFFCWWNWKNFGFLLHFFWIFEAVKILGIKLVGAWQHVQWMLRNKTCVDVTCNTWISISNCTLLCCVRWVKISLCGNDWLDSLNKEFFYPIGKILKYPSGNIGRKKWKKKKNLTKKIQNEPIRTKSKEPIRTKSKKSIRTKLKEPIRTKPKEPIRTSAKNPLGQYPLAISLEIPLKTECKNKCKNKWISTGPEPQRIIHLIPSLF